MANKIDYIDTNVGLTQIYNSILTNIKTGKIAEVNASGLVYQELGFNQASPIWGYSPRNLDSNPPNSNTSTSTTPTHQNTSIPFTDSSTYLFAISIVGVVSLIIRKRKSLK